MYALVLAALLGASPEADAKTAVAAFKKSLLQTLTQAMQQSPEAAIDVCHAQAPALAKAASSAHVTVGRSAFKLRNPANAPRPWVEKVMRELSGEQAGSTASRTVALPGGVTGYAEPLFVGPQCLGCHGTALAPEVKAKLDALYPGDTARGFEPGAFRGVVWAEVK